MCCPVCPHYPCSATFEGEECCEECELFVDCFDFVEVEDEDFIGIGG